MMTKNYARLAFSERVEIEKLLSHNWSYSAIAMHLHRSKSTIQREVVGYGRGNYKALSGEWDAVCYCSDRKSGKTKMKVCPELEKYVLKKLELRWSPRQISMKLKNEFAGQHQMQLCHEPIYMYIYLHAKKELKGELIAQLRQKRKFRGNVRRGADKRTTIADPIRIDERLQDYLKKQVNKLGANLKMTHQDIANDLNSSREVISRLFKKMEAKGWVTIHRNSIEWMMKK